jgi:hypothetical protein
VGRRPGGGGNRKEERNTRSGREPLHQSRIAKGFPCPYQARLRAFRARRSPPPMGMMASGKKRGKSKARRAAEKAAVAPLLQQPLHPSTVRSCSRVG